MCLIFLYISTNTAAGSKSKSPMSTTQGTITKNDGHSPVRRLQLPNKEEKSSGPSTSKLPAESTIKERKAKAKKQNGQCEKSFANGTVVTLQRMTSENSDLKGRLYKIVSFNKSEGRYTVEDIENENQWSVTPRMLMPVNSLAAAAAAAVAAAAAQYSPSDTKEDGYCASRTLLEQLKALGVEVT